MTGSLANTSQQKRVQLEKLLKEKKRKVAPASFAQRRLWLLDQIDPNSAHYNLPFAIELHGDLKVGALNDAFNKLVERHEILRTTFVVQNDEPAQVIHAPTKVRIATFDLTDCDEREKNSESRNLLSKATKQPFNLISGPLFRVNLICLDKKMHLLVLTIHHIVTDGWSNSILIRELSELYRAAVSGEQAMLPDLEIQYSDFALWQQNRLNGGVLSAQLNYWVKQLEDIAPLELPTDRVRPAVQTFNGALRHQTLSAELTNQIRDFCQSHGVSLYMGMLACFNILLQRYASQDDISIGSPIANRNRAEIENLIGFFVNSIVIRTDLSGDPEFLTLLENVKENTLAAFEHQDIPFEKLVEELQPERNRSKSPLFQVMFTVQNAPASEFELTGLSFKIPPTEIQTVRFDIEVFIWEQADGLILGFNYNTDLFDAATIDRMMGHYQELLRAVFTGPSQCISGYNMLSTQEKQQLVDWNNTDSDYPRQRTVQELFEQQVTATPDANAVVYAEEALSYRELNQGANRLAQYLIAAGIKSDSPVVVLMERTPDLVIAQLAILKAGAAYVAIDPDYPTRRLEFILADTQSPVLLTQSSLSDRITGYQGRILCLDRDSDALADQSTQTPVVDVGAENIAYVIYTSGSTGEPKGVEVMHGGLTNLVSWHCRAYQVTPEDRATHLAGLGFDASVWELWPYLSAGASIHLVPEELRLSPATLWPWMATQGITLSFMPTPLAEAALQEPLPTELKLRVLLTGGDRLHGGLVDKELPFRVVNHYGPTENTVVATCAEVDFLAPGEPSIGKPVDNVQTFILDRYQQPVPVGVPGELYIGGDGLARGYLNQPELTAEKFVHHPFAANDAARLYRTGDTVRYRIDGSIEFIGRIDHQVKLRGYRIELGEIETVLANFEAVHDAVVMVREDEPGDKRLVAYTVPTPAWIEKISSSRSGEHVSEWRALYEETYGNTPDEQDLTFNITGWGSSYTGEPIPAVEMHEWVDVTVARIAAFKPKRVLEIGCGTGLLLYRLAPECERYVGTDFSEVAQQQVRSMVADLDSHKHVELWQRLADDFSDVEAGDFDTVIINSVVQYFPNMDYLVQVLQGAVAAVSAGGRVIVGDIRSLPLLKSYHSSVQLYLSSDKISVGELKRNIQQHVEEENELVIEPAFFDALKQRLPRLSHVEVLLKQGEYHNELTGYRYDVVLHVEAVAAALPSNGQWLNWGVSGLNEVQLQAMLTEADQAWLGIHAISNARVSGDVAILEQLEADGKAESVGELKQGVESELQQAIDPAALWRLAAATGYQLELSYTDSGADGHMDALFRRNGREACAGKVFWPREEIVPERRWNAYGTNPLKGTLGRELIPHLKDELELRLPAYMVPSVFVVLDTLPLMASGKVDRKALPVPGDLRAGLGKEYTAPRTALEEELVGIWCELLNLDRVGIHDNFFDLGGHSLMATRAVSRLRQLLKLEVSVASLFEYPTVAALAEYVATMQWVNESRVGEILDPDGNRQVGEL